MSSCEWLPAPIGIDSDKWITRTGCRNALIVIHTVTGLHRLMDVVDLIESDPRIQVTFTVAPDAFNHGVPRHLRDLGALVLPWGQAVKECFDIVLAASYGGLHELHGPLMVMAHGAGRGKLTQRHTYGGPALAVPTVYGLDAARLTRDGRVVASAIVLSHDAESEILSRQCPEALPVATVAGDICFDRLIASLPERERYRLAFGVTGRQQLLVVSSTWGPDSLFGRAADLIPRLIAQLSAPRVRVGALLHPAVWAAHGTRQVRAWLRESCEAGLILMDPTEDWRPLAIAADCLIGDHGSVTAYAAAIGRPVLRLATTEPSGPESSRPEPFGPESFRPESSRAEPSGAVPSRIVPGSAQAIVMEHAELLDLDLPVGYQIESARPVMHPALTAAVTSRPGEAAELIRKAIYNLARLDEPRRSKRLSPVPLPYAARLGW